jgi:hypothetical protein
MMNKEQNKHYKFQTPLLKNLSDPFGAYQLFYQPSSIKLNFLTCQTDFYPALPMIQVSKSSPP